MYVSDHTHFIQDLLQRKPDLPQKQREGRALLWDKTLDTELEEGFAAARVVQSPYVYQNHPQPEQDA